MSDLPSSVPAMITRTLRLCAAVLGLLLAAGADPFGHPAGLLLRDDDRSRGNPNAPLTLVEYSDYTCRFCVKFFHETWPRLNAEYVERGLVRFVYRDFPRAVQGPGLQAAVAARCAGEQGRYWQMHDHLFADESRTLSTALEGQASAIGLDPRAFNACLREGRHVEAVLKERHEGEALGFHGTPSFVLIRTDPSADGTAVALPGAFPFEVFEAQIQRLLSKSKG